MGVAFTAAGAWSGGFYEMKLCLGSPSAEGVDPALNALWSYPMLKGPYSARDIEPEEQQRTEGLLSSAGYHLYGLATFPQGFKLPCGTFAVREEGDAGSIIADFVSLYFPMGAVAMHFPAGGYPFGNHQEAASWRAEVDRWFLDLLRCLKGKIHFDICVIGWEPELSAQDLEYVKNSTKGTERFDGVVLDDRGELQWFPPTRFDIVTLR